MHMNKSQQYIGRVTEDRHKRLQTVWFHVYEVQEQAKLFMMIESRTVVIYKKTGIGWNEAQREHSRMMKVFCILIWVLVIDVYPCHNHQTSHLQSVFKCYVNFYKLNTLL